MKEIERKYIAVRPEDVSEHPWSVIKQGYAAILGDGMEFRLREECPRLAKKAPSNLLGWLTELFFKLISKFKPPGNRYTLTVKSGGEKVRIETEIEITPDQFGELWPMTAGKQLSKIRYRIPYGRQTIELDVYLGKLDGLVVAEVEFDSEEAGNNFVPPEWFGEEVTEDKRYKNKNLALNGMPKK
ncbi:MAG TPA: adenylate cyclase [Candidatus Paceibacterota bacterium]|nr:adenylate cyclase [Candidatus Paceibacterota bacterium]